jgi:2-polyprenyl-6-methoxyphenol hydroxylase-like FAD-dependent oxidoreductase
VTDVAIYGATAAGVMAAVAAARDGASVTLLEPGRHVGGMVTGGLGRSDVEGQEALLGGLVLEFARRLGDADDLLVTCAVSASHVAYDGLRLEPTFMVLGEAAGAAAALAVERGVDPGDVPIGELRDRLARHGALVDLPAVAA